MDEVEEERRKSRLAVHSSSHKHYLWVWDTMQEKVSPELYI